MLKNGPKPDFLRGRVAYHVMAEEQWKYADSLEAIAPTRRRLYLTSGVDGANDAFHLGTLAWLRRRGLRKLAADRPVLQGPYRHPGTALGFSQKL